MQEEKLLLRRGFSAWIISWVAVPVGLFVMIQNEVIPAYIQHKFVDSFSYLICFPWFLWIFFKYAPQGNYLLLTSQGFIQCAFFKKKQANWKDILIFNYFERSQGFFGRDWGGGSIEYKYKYKYNKDHQVKSMNDVRFWNITSMPVKDLCKLLNEWRERYS